MLPQTLLDAVPLDLPRLLMRRAAAVALTVLVLALALGLARMGHDIDDEVDAAVTLGRLVALLGSLAQTEDAALLQALRREAAEHPPRHLLLSVHDSTGRVLLSAPPLPPAPAPLNALLALHRQLLSAPDLRHVSWQVDRPGGARWVILLAASHESERREAMANLVGTLGLLLACIAGLLLAMRWNLRRALAPLGRLLAAIASIEGHDSRAVQALPRMPVRELEAVAAALRHLGTALTEAEAQRRLLSQQVLSLQEDERARLARELHDEFGQRLTALRVDAAWLARRLADQPEPARVVAGMAEQCQQIQLDIRSLLQRLQPFGHPADGRVDGQSLARLTQLLQALVSSWSPAAAGNATACTLDLRVGVGATSAPDSRAVPDSPDVPPWPVGAPAEALVLPQALALTLYRISQEALTNVARHAQARNARLQLVLRGGLRAGQAVQIDWSVADDGIGLPPDGSAQQRGNGISGIRERVWAQGGELGQVAGLQQRGLALTASFALCWMAESPAAAAAMPAAGPAPGGSA